MTSENGTQTHVYPSRRRLCSQRKFYTYLPGRLDGANYGYERVRELQAS